MFCDSTKTVIKKYLTRNEYNYTIYNIWFKEDMEEGYQQPYLVFLYVM